MADRYFVEPPIVADRAVVAGAEAHHLIHVMRCGPGGRVTLFDGSGCEFAAVVRRVGRSEVELDVLDRREIDRELPMRLTLGVALPKGDRQRWLVEKAVEVGIGRLVPLATERGVAQPVANAIERLRRSVIEASKQCGRNRLMEIAEPRAWSDFLVDTRTAGCRLLAHPAAEGCITGTGPDVGGETVLAVGPEGGFTDAEVARAIEAGWRAVDLGPRILRVETAAIWLAARVGGCR